MLQVLQTKHYCRLSLLFKTPLRPVKAVMDWAAKSATGALLTPATSIKDFCIKRGQFGGYGLGGCCR